MRKLIVAFAVVVAVLLLTQATTGTAVAGATTRYHLVQPGETLSSIAYKYGVTTWAIASANGVWNPNLIYVGQVLTIPYGGGYCSWCGYKPYPVYYPRPTYNCYYWVKYGDTMTSIAWRYGGDPWRIARANGIYNLNWIYAGQRLLIPGCN